MAAKLQCEICGGKLVGKPGGIFECENCGTEYSTAWAKEKIQEITGKVQVEGTVEVKGKVQVDGGTVQVDTSANKEALLKRAFMFLKDRNWERAGILLDQVLNIDPECVQAYLGVLMVTLRVRQLTDLARLDFDDYTLQGIQQGWKPSLDEMEEYKKVMLYADADLKQFLCSCSDAARYTIADKVMAKGLPEDYSFAAQQFARIKGYKDAEQKRAACERATTQANELTLRILALMYPKRRSVPERKRPSISIPTIGLKGATVACLTAGGSVTTNGENERDWDHIVSISVAGSIVMGLKSDGTVVADRRFNTDYFKEKQNDPAVWRDIVAIQATNVHMVGLKADGTVVAVENCRYGRDDNQYGQCNVNGWRNIVAIAASPDHTVGLQADGRVVAVGNNDQGQCNVSQWSNIVAIAVSNDHTVGLKTDGTVVAVGSNKCGKCNVGDWRDIIRIKAHGNVDTTVGFRADGTVAAAGDGSSTLSGWRDIVDISFADRGGIEGFSGGRIGLRSDGTLIADVEKGKEYYNEWNHVVAIACGPFGSVGLKDDGSIVKYPYDFATPAGFMFHNLFNDADALIGLLERRNREEMKALQNRQEDLKRRVRSEKQRKQEAEARLSNLSGLFAGMRRQGIETEIAEAEEHLAALQAELKNLS